LVYHLREILAAKLRAAADRSQPAFCGSRTVIRFKNR
jgi:hypothetical protein